VRKNTQAGRRRPCGVFFFDDRKETACLWHSQMQISLGRLRQSNGCVLGAPLAILQTVQQLCENTQLRWGKGNLFVHLYIYTQILVRRGPDRRYEARICVFSYNLLCRSSICLRNWGEMHKCAERPIFELCHVQISLSIAVMRKLKT
jgi:hypothetical protein